MFFVVFRFFKSLFFVFESNQNESRRVSRRYLIQVLVSLFIIISVVFARKGLTNIVVKHNLRSLPVVRGR